MVSKQEQRWLEYEAAVRDMRPRGDNGTDIRSLPSPAEIDAAMAERRRRWRQDDYYGKATEYRCEQCGSTECEGRECLWRINWDVKKTDRSSR